MKHAIAAQSMSRWIACCILALGTLATAPFALMAQQITSLAELDAAAGETWSRHRNHVDLDFGMAIEERTVRVGFANLPDVDATISLVRFADKNLLLYKAVSNYELGEAGLEFTHVFASNEQVIFHVTRPAKPFWQLSSYESGSAVEKLANSQKKELSVLMREIKRGLDDDFRYLIGDKHVSEFLRDNEGWVRAIREAEVNSGDTDSQSSETVVVIELEGRIEGTARSRQRAGVDHTLVSGSIRLLPARQWSVLDYKFTHSGRDAAGAEVSPSYMEMKSHFSEGVRYPQRIERVKWNTQGYKNQVTRSYRPLTMDEIAEIQAQCHLETYGLSVPSGDDK